MALEQISFLTDEKHNVLTDEINNRLFIREVKNMPTTAINTDRLLITTIDRITAYNNANELEFIMDEIQDTTLSNSQENTDITGKNGAVIGRLKRNKAVTISGNNGFIVGGVLAAMTGSEVETGTFNIRTMEILTVTSNKVTITNDAQGAEGAEIVACYKRNTNGSLGQKFEQDATASATGKFTYSDKAITFYTGDLEDGDQVVVFYDMETTNAAKITNASDTYSKTLKVYIDITASDNCDNVYRGQIVIPRCDFSGNMDLTFGSDAAVQSFEANSLRDTCSGTGNLWEWYIFA